MDLQEAINKGFTVILDPSADYEYPDPTTFLSSYYKDGLEIAVVAKNELGKVHYRSFSAPKDNQHPEYFSSFAQIASEFEIPVHGVIHSFGDAFLGHDPNYSCKRGIGGEEIPEFVSPANTSFWKYTSSIAKEVCRHNISSLIIAEHYFPRLGYCMDRSVQTELKNLVGERIRSLDEILNDEDLFFKFVEWRAGAVNSALNEIVETVKRENAEINVEIIIPLDPVTEWLTGAGLHLGLELDLLANTCDGFIMHLMPWSPMFPTTGGHDWLELAERLKLIRKKYPNKRLSLLLGNLEQEWDVSWFESLAQEIRADKIYGYMANGRLFNIKREIHRGTTRDTY
ncbi:MAG: hypothetical protein ACXAC7_00080 [Candidatus Hodarchaeales archaeon]